MAMPWQCHNNSMNIPRTCHGTYYERAVAHESWHGTSHDLSKQSNALSVFWKSLQKGLVGEHSRHKQTKMSGIGPTIFNAFFVFFILSTLTTHSFLRAPHIHLIPSPAQAITIMIGELLHFTLVLGVVMMGFTVAFFAIFSKERSYANVWLDVFKAMLGEVGVFDDFFDDAYGDVARFLLVVYLLVMTVLLLNLLIAILSTEHAKIEQGQDRAYRISKVRIIKLYSRIVDHDLQPPPFNLVQLALGLPFLTTDMICNTRTHEKAKRIVGGLVFWLIMGPASILVAWGLSAASTPSTVLALWRDTIENRFRGTSSVYFVLCSATAVIFRVFCVPVLLSGLWIKTGLMEYFWSAKDLVMSLTSGTPGGVGVEVEPSPGDYSGPHRGGSRRGTEFPVVNYGDDKPPESNAISVTEMLKRTPGRKQSVRDIWLYLEDLASTGGVHQKRSDKESPATTQHLNRMRSQLQSSSEKRGDVLLAHLQSIDAAVKSGVQEVGSKVNARVDASDRRVEERIDRLEEKLAAIVAEYLAKERR